MHSPVQPASAAAPVPFAAGAAGAAAGEAPAVEAVVTAPVAAAAQPAGAQPGSTEQAPNAALPRAAVGRFLGELEGAIAGQLVTVELFTDEFIREVGVEQTAQLLQQYQPSDIIQTARAQGFAATCTRDGQRYVHALWQVATAKISALLRERNVAPQPAAPAAPAPPVPGAAAAPAPTGEPAEPPPTPPSGDAPSPTPDGGGEQAAE